MPQRKKRMTFARHISLLVLQELRIGSGAPIVNWKTAITQITAQTPYLCDQLWALFALLLISVVTTVSFAITYFWKVTVRHLRHLLDYDIELRNAAFRIQLNPHFIFNSLNTLNNYILRSNPELASTYLTNFSRFLRLHLDSSTSKTTELHKEIIMLELYIKLEQLRFNNRFTAQLHIAKDVNTRKLKIPSLVLRNFIEEAIWSCVSSRQGNGKLFISFRLENNTLICIIESSASEKSQEINQYEKLSESTIGSPVLVDTAPDVVRTIDDKKTKIIVRLPAICE